MTSSCYGNIAPATGNLEFIKACEARLPKEHVIASVRLDSAGCQADIFNYLDSTGKTFAIGGRLIEAADSAMQPSILHELAPARAVDVLEAMEPDEAADLLGELPGEESHALIESMAPDTAAELQQLLGHGEDSAGAMMTTSFLAVSGEATVKDCLKWFRESHPDIEPNAYFYLMSAEGQLSGVVSLRRMLFAAEHEHMAELSPKRIYHVHVHTPRQQAVEMISRYKLLALPVLDAGNRIAGVITVHDVLAYLQGERNK